MILKTSVTTLRSRVMETQTLTEFAIDTSPIVDIARAEAEAIQQLCVLFAGKESMSQPQLTEWLTTRGWKVHDLRRWEDRIGALLAEREGVDLKTVQARLTTRLQRIAHKAETADKFDQAVKATEAEARLHGILKDQLSPTIAVQFNAPGAIDPRSLSDDELRARLVELDRRLAAPTQAATVEIDDLLA